MFEQLLCVLARVTVVRAQSEAPKKEALPITLEPGNVKCLLAQVAEDLT